MVRKKKKAEKLVTDSESNWSSNWSKSVNTDMNFRQKKFKAKKSKKNKNRDNDNDSQWFKICIPNASKMEKSVVLQLIQESSQLYFTPFNYTQSDIGVVFHVLGEETAEALKALSRKISTPTGNKMVVFTQKSGFPPMAVSQELKNTIKAVMSQRFDVNSNVIDLSNLKEDPNLSQFMSLSNKNMLNTVIDIIVENSPQIIGLNLKNNKIQSLEALKQLSYGCPQLKAIDLSYNQIRNVSELDHIRRLELIELCLDGNPFCDLLESSYLSFMRRRFPKLAKLDNEEIPPEIGFHIIEEVLKLPQNQPGYLPKDMNIFVQSFIKSYYDIYDSEDRLPLLKVYDESALFSYCVTQQESSSHGFCDNFKNNSRNLLKTLNYKKRNKLIHSGVEQIVTVLCGLFPTRHELESFKIEVPFRNNAFILVVVNGVFQEMFKKQKPLRAFCRTFYLVPKGQGFVIVNDILLVTNPSPDQIRSLALKKLESGAQSIDHIVEGFESRLGPFAFDGQPSNEDVVNQFNSLQID